MRKLLLALLLTISLLIPASMQASMFGSGGSCVSAPSDHTNDILKVSTFGMLGCVSTVSQFPSMAQYSQVTRAGAISTAVNGDYVYGLSYSNSTLDRFHYNDTYHQITNTFTSVTTGTNPVGLAIGGNYAYVMNYTGGSLQIFDISDTSNPPTLKSTTSITTAYFVVVQGIYAYVTDYTGNNLRIYDITDPTAPASVSTTGTGAATTGIAIQNTTVYLTSGNNLKIYDVSTPATPSLLSTTVIGTDAEGLYVSGNYALATAYTGNLWKLVDVSNPSSPIVKSTTSLNTAYGAYISGNYAFVDSYIGGTITLYDITDPTAPVYVERQVSPGRPQTLNAVNTTYNVMFVAANSGNAVYAISLRYPLYNPGTLTALLGNGVSQAVLSPNGAYLYYVDGSSGANVIEVRLSDFYARTVLTEGGYYCVGLGIDTANDRLFLNCYDNFAPTTSYVFRHRISDGVQTGSINFGADPAGSGWIAMDLANNRLGTYVRNGTTHAHIWTINLTSMGTTASANTYLYLSGIQYNPATNEFYSQISQDNAPWSAGMAIAVDATTLLQNSNPVMTAGVTYYGVLDPTNNKYFVGNYSDQVVAEAPSNPFSCGCTTNDLGVLAKFSFSGAYQATKGYGFLLGADTVTYATAFKESDLTTLGSKSLEAGSGYGVGAMQFNGAGDTAYILYGTNPVQINKYSVR